VVAAGIPASDLFAPPPPPVPAAGELVLDGLFDTKGNMSYFDTEIVSLDLVSVGYNNSSKQAKVTRERFTEPGSLVIVSDHELRTPGVFFSQFRRVDYGVLDPSSRPPQIVAAGGGFNGSVVPPHFQGMLEFYELGSLNHMAEWVTPMPFDVFFLDVAVGNVNGFGYDYWVAVGHVPGSNYDDRGIVVVGQYSGGFIPPPVIQEFSGSWLYFTAVEIAELNDPPVAPPEIILAGVRENKSFLQIARFDSAMQRVVNLANISLPSPLESIPWAVNVSDIDGDLVQDIIVGGQEGNAPQYSTRNQSRVSVWNWDGATQIIPKDDRIWTGVNGNSAVYDVEVADFLPSVPGLEVATTGYNFNSPTNLSMGAELNLMDNKLDEIDSMFTYGSETDHWGMSSGDPDGDGILEIVTVGMKTTGATEVGETQVVEVPEFGFAAAVVPLIPAGATLSRRLLDRFRARKP